MTNEKINRINELAKKSKTVGLTLEEKKEQADLRQEYINEIKSSLMSELNRIKIVDDKSNK